MTPTNEQIIAEARRRAKEQNWRMDIEDYIIEVMREGWKPPEPTVDPDLMAFREWLVEQWPDLQEEATSGETDSIIPARAFLAGARMAREQERERAKELLDQAKAIIDQHARLLARLPLGLRAQIGIEGVTIMNATSSFYATLAEYRGEA